MKKWLAEDDGRDDIIYSLTEGYSIYIGTA